MNESTNVYKWLPWAIAFALALVIMPGFSLMQFNSVGSAIAIGIWETAQGIEVVRAIHFFSEGVSDMKPYWSGRVTALSGLLLLFVIGPSLWIYSELQNEQRELNNPEDALRKGFAWYAGVVLVMAGLLYTIPVSGVKAYHFTQTWSSADQSRNLDELRSDLVTMAFDAAEKYYLMTGESGNREGTGFMGNEGKGAVREAFLPENLEGYKESIRNNYVLGEGISDSVLVIFGVGEKEGPKESFANADGSTGKLQLGIKVTPEGEPIFEFIDRDQNTRYSN